MRHSAFRIKNNDLSLLDMPVLTNISVNFRASTGSTRILVSFHWIWGLWHHWLSMPLSPLLLSLWKYADDKGHGRSLRGGELWECYSSPSFPNVHFQIWSTAPTLRYQSGFWRWFPVRQISCFMAPELWKQTLESQRAAGTWTLKPKDGECTSSK